MSQDPDLGVKEKMDLSAGIYFRLLRFLNGSNKPAESFSAA
jgi:hypothetical protein